MKAQTVVMRACACAILFGAAVSAHAQQYALIAFGGQSGTGTEGFGINSWGEITGGQLLGVAFVYSRGVIIPIAPVTQAGSGGFAINDREQVAGQFSPSPGVQHAGVYSMHTGSWTDLQVGTSTSAALGINVEGQVTGEYITPSGSQHAFIYTRGEVHDLGSFTQNDAGTSIGSGINILGQVAGYSLTNLSTGVAHAFLYKNGFMHDLGTLGGSNSYGYGLNDEGEVVGSSDLGENIGHAFVYRNGIMHDLGTLDDTVDAPASVAYAINNRGEIVGKSLTAVGLRAFVYRDGHMLNLNSLVACSPLAQYTTLLNAKAINDAGWIVANGFDNRVSVGGARAYLLIPDTRQCRH